ncbi:MAG: zinc ribbon domain-containing protein [Desulfomicrobium escambiense]|nr:zinc ribbon domain-containing protein [Desulfomicrobium escambiense]
MKCPVIAQGNGASRGQRSFHIIDETGGYAMPIYEYFCKPCNTIYQFLIKRVTHETSPVCPRCGEKELERVMSRFSTPNTRTGDDDMDGMAGELAGLDENDPRAMARAVRKMADQMGKNLALNWSMPWAVWRPARTPRR